MLGSFLLLLAIPAADSWTIGPDDSQESIDAVFESAMDGDVIYMGEGEYSALVVEGKGLTLAPEREGAIVRLVADPVTGVSLAVRSLPEGSTFTTVSLQFSSLQASLNRYAVSVENCGGAVVLQNPRLFDPTTEPFEPAGINTLLRAVNSGLVVLDGADVPGNLRIGNQMEAIVDIENTDLVVNRSSLIGSGSGTLGNPGALDGQTVLEASNSRLTLSDCTLTGGDGLNSPLPIGPVGANCSGAGLELRNGSVARCFGTTSITGGISLLNTPTVDPPNSCPAQPAVRLDASSRFEYVESTVLAAGSPIFSGPATPPIVSPLETQAILVEGELTRSELDSVGSSGATLAYQLSLFGAEGNLEFVLFQALSPDGLQELPEVFGFVGVDPTLATLAGPVLLGEPAGGLPNGILSFELPAASNLVGRSFWAQSAHFEVGSGSLRTSTLTSLVVLP